MKIRSLNSRKASIIILLALMSAYTFLCMTRNCFSSAMVFIVDEKILTKFETGVINALFYVAYSIMQIVGGVITDKFNPERFITIGLLGAAASNFVIYFNQNYIVMIIAWSFNAAMQFGVWPAVFKITSSLLSENMRENSLFIATLASPAGVVSSYVVAAIVSSHWQLNFIISAIGLIVLALLWEVTFRSVTPYVVETEIEEVAQSDTEITSEPSIGLGKMLLKSGLVIVIVLVFLRAMFDFGIKGMTPTMINESYESVTPVLATVMNIVVLVAGVIGIFLAHYIYPRFIKNEATALAILFCISLPLAILTLFIGKLDYRAMVVVLALIVMLMNACALFTTSYIAARFNRYGKGATVAGILNASASLGIVLANTLFPGLAETVGWEGTVVVWAVMMSVATLLAIIYVPFWVKFLKKSRSDML